MNRSINLDDLGYAVGQLLQSTSLRSKQSLAKAARQFLANARIALVPLSSEESHYFQAVGRGYATEKSKRRS